jgi:hypothetical protein
VPENYIQMVLKRFYVFSYVFDNNNAYTNNFLDINDSFLTFEKKKNNGKREF